jgi:hypothetical protein
MARNRVLVQFPPDLIAEVDRLAGKGKRTAFLVDLARREVKRRRLLKILEDAEPIWKDEDHPELAEGVNEWVRKMRAESDRRLKEIFD